MFFISVFKSNDGLRWTRGNDFITQQHQNRKVRILEWPLTFQSVCVILLGWTPAWSQWERSRQEIFIEIMDQIYHPYNYINRFNQLLEKLPYFFPLLIYTMNIPRNSFSLNQETVKGPRMQLITLLRGNIIRPHIYKEFTDNACTWPSLLSIVLMVHIRSGKLWNIVSCIVW